MAETEEVEAEAWLPTPDEGESLARGRSRRRAAVAAARKLAPPKKRVCFDLDQVEKDVVEYVKASRPRALTYGEKLDVLLVQCYLRRQFRDKKTKYGKAFRGVPPRYDDEVAKVLRRGQKQIKQTWRDFIENKHIKVAQLAGNSRRKATFIPDTRKVLRTLQEFMRKRREIRQRTVARDLLECVLDNQFIHINRSDPQRMASALRAMQRYIVRKGFKRGRKKGCQHYRLKEHNLRARDEYVLRMMDENSKKTRRIVYMDESYVHKNYCLVSFDVVHSPLQPRFSS